MHTFVLSMVLSDDGIDYDNIKKALPFGTKKLNQYAEMFICKTSKMNISEEAKKTIPVIKLYKFVEAKTTADGNKKPTGKLHIFSKS